MKLKFGSKFIPDIRKATVSALHRGYPVVSCYGCAEMNCASQCPTGAIDKDTLNLDLGKCIFCGECAEVCAENRIELTNFYKTGTTRREDLILTPGMTTEEFYRKAIQIKKEVHKVFHRSLKLRQVSAAGCNGCEMELNACSNINFDMSRFGIEFVASPKHSDGIVITGPISQNMSDALKDAWNCTPHPKLLILTGACAISGGVFADSPALNREFLDKHHVDLYIPGCPVHPLTFINAVLDFIGY